jgi:hypothetical protein
MFGEVLEQAGVGKGLELQDLLGDNGLTKRFNPSTRGAVGLALDIFTDPTTYVTAPAKNAATLLGTSGEIRYLNKKGTKLLTEQYEKQIQSYRKQLNLADDVDSARVLDEIRKRGIMRQEVGEEAAALFKTHSFGRMEAAAHVRAQAEDVVRATGRTDIYEKGGLRFRPPGGFIDLPLGVDRAIVYAGGKAASWMKAGMTSTDIGEALYKVGSGTIENLQKLVQRHPKLAKFNKPYIRMEARFFQKFQSSAHIAGMEIDSVLTGVTKKQLQDQELWIQFARAVEDPLEDQIKIFAEMAQARGLEDGAGLVQRWRRYWDRQQLLEVRAGLLDEGTYLERRGRVFWPLSGKVDKRQRGLLENAAGQSYKNRGLTPVSRRDLGTFDKTQGFSGVDEMIQAAKDLDINPNKLGFNPREVGQARLQVSYEQLLQAKFIDDTVSRFGWKTSKPVSRMAAVLGAKGAQITKREQQEITEVLARDISDHTGSAADAEINKFITNIFKESDEGKFIDEMGKFWQRMVGDTQLTPGQADYLAKRSLSEYKRFQKLVTEYRIADSNTIKSGLLQQAKNVKALRDSQKLREKAAKAGIDDTEVQHMRRTIAGYRENLKRMREYTEGPLATRELAMEIKAQEEILKGLRAKLAAEAGVIRGAFQIQFDEINKQLGALERGRKRMQEKIRVTREAGRALDQGMAEYGNPLQEILRNLKKEGVLPKQLEESLARSGVKISEVKKAQREAREAFEARVTKEAVSKEDMQRIRRWKPTKRAAYFAAALGEIDDLTTLRAFLGRYKNDIIALDSKLKGTNFKSLLDEMYDGETIVLRDSFGQAYKSTRVANRPIEVPEGIKQDLDNFREVYQANKEVHELLNTYDILNNWFKIGVTRYFPSFYSRNGYSNVASSFVDIGLVALHPGRAKQVLDIMRGADGTFKISGGPSITFDAFRQEIDTLGVRVDKLLIAEQTGNARGDPVEKFIQWRLRKGALDEKAAGIAEKAWSIPNNVENHARVMHYAALRRRGFSPEDASFQVNKFLFDYADLSAVEKGFFRRIFPFWTWNRKNAELQIHNLLERPGRIATQMKVATQDRGPDGDHLPEYLRGQMSVKLEEGPDGETWMTGIDLPISSMDILWAGSLEKTFKEQISMLTPFIKTPLEVGVGHEFFTGGATRGVGEIRPALGASLNRDLPKKMKEYFELENVGTAEKPKWVGNRLKIHLVFKGGLISRFVSQRVMWNKFKGELERDEDGALLRGVMKMMVGLDLRAYDLDGKQKRMLWNRARELEQLLIDKGLMREFTRRFIPKEDVPGAKQKQRPLVF